MIDVVGRSEREENGSRSAAARRARSWDDEAEISVADVAKSAQQHIAALTGKRALSVTSVDPTEDGWLVEVELVEEKRIPDSLDVLALYELELDVEGQLVAYRRTTRYSRSSSLKGTK